MKTSTIVWIIVVIIIILGGWYWYINTPSISNPNTAAEPAINAGIDAQGQGAVTEPTTNTGSNPQEQGAVAEPTTNTGSNTQGTAQPNGGNNTTSPVITVATDSQLGKYLVAANGMTLYTYSKDTKDVSNCSGGCAAAWPPYTIAGSDKLVGGAGVGGKIGVIKRSDGSTQVTYNGMPLYFYQRDTKPGDTTGDKVGGVWFVVKP